MDSSTIEEVLRQGIALAKAGQKEDARSLLGYVVKCDPQSVLGWLWLAGVVETKEQQRYCLERALHLNPKNEVVRRVLTQLKSEEPSTTVGSEYFVGCSLASGGVDGVGQIITDVFGSLGHRPIEINRWDDEGRSLLLKICQKIFLATFSVFDLSSNDPNDYIELGIALGLNRPVVVMAEQSLPPLLSSGCQAITYTGHAELRTRLSQLCERGFPPTSRPTRDYCYFCGRVCKSMATPPLEKTYVVLNASKILWRNLMRSLMPHLAQYGLEPIYLTERASGSALCDMRQKVLATEFALCHLGSLSNEDSFLALGLAIGSQTPWLLLAQEGGDPVPSDLRGVDQVVYANFTDLEEHLVDVLGLFLGKVLPGSVPKNDKTAMLSLPFWIELGDWISRVKHATKAPEVIQGTMRLIQYKGSRQLSQYTVPEGGLTFGRSSDCDVVLENPGVSSRHFRILRGRNRRHFIEDLYSKNGTFLNGTRLSPGKRVEISPKDAIRIPSARFLVWDNRPLPEQEAAQIVGDTDLLPPILKIDIPDVSPPTYLSTWDHSLKLTVSLPDRRSYSTFEVQAYYPMGRIIAEVVDLLGLPDKKYCFMVENEVIGNEETPLSAGIQKTDILILVPEDLRAGGMSLST